MPCWHGICKVYQMIESSFSSQTQTHAQTQRILTYVKNERMGGFVPKYETRTIAKQQESNRVETHIIGAQGQDSLNLNTAQSQGKEEDQFGFGDILDMMNPLQHIPIVGHIYREITGDHIKPASKIVGGAAFGGPIGLAGALIDMVVANETGNDMAGNAMQYAFNRNAPKPTPQLAANESQLSPEKSIENTLASIQDQGMTSALLAFSDLAVKEEPTTNTEQPKKTGLYAL